MQNQQVFQNVTPVDEPHFEEEWTLLNARPVVPLSQLRAVSRRRTLLLIAAFAVASVLGSVVALVGIRLRQDQSTPMVEAPAETGEDTPSVTPMESTAVEQGTVEPQQLAKPALSETRREGGVRVERVRSRGKADQIDESQPSADVQPGLVDQWEEHRPRRVTRRQMRRAGRQNRDLLRIDELFEGARP